MSKLLLKELLQRYPQLECCKEQLCEASAILEACYSEGGTVYTCGNGGSAADSEHIVGELMKSFKVTRPVDPLFSESYRKLNGEEPPAYLEGAIPAMSLVSQSALMTAFSNDESAEGVFAQQIFGYGRPGDVLICVSTSGNSANVVAAAKVARAKGVSVIALVGARECKLSGLADVAIAAPETETFKVQELHLPIYHYLCAELESRLYASSNLQNRGVHPRNREAVILAGGFGTRLLSRVPNTPKPMAPVANRPFLRYLLDMLADNRFYRVVIADGYLREQIEEYFGDSYRGIQIAYSPEDEPLGTGGATKKALSICEQDLVFVLNGDTFFEVDFDAMEKASLESGFSVMGVKQMYDFDRYGTVQVGLDGTVAGFKEKKPCDSGLINGGVYLLHRNDLSDMSEKFSFETDWLQEIGSAGKLAAVESDGYFIDIGIPEDYELAQSVLAPRAKKWKLAFFDRDGTINEDTGHLHKPSDLKLIDSTVELIRQYNAQYGWKVVVATNQAGIAKGIYEERDMHAVHDRLDDLLLEQGAVVDAYYFCPHHPDFTGECDCRKPAPGMLLQAIKEYDADPSECIMYGDKPKDMMAAKEAGVTGVLV